MSLGKRNAGQYQDAEDRFPVVRHGIPGRTQVNGKEQRQDQAVRMNRRNLKRLAFVALLTGAVGIAFAPIFVRLSEIGPSATAFYRLFFALPWHWLWLSA